jgi:hypothetical protein
VFSQRADGGSVGVRCDRDSVTLDYAIPATGFTATVQNAGPAEAVVTFASSSHTSKVAAVCRSGQAQFTVKENETEDG